MISLGFLVIFYLKFIIEQYRSCLFVDHSFELVSFYRVDGNTGYSSLFSIIISFVFLEACLCCALLAGTALIIRKVVPYYISNR